MNRASVVLPRAAGAYVLTHVKTGCFYVGSSGDLSVRVKRHLYVLEKKLHFHKRLQELFNADPEVVVTYDLAVDREAAFDLEQALLDKHWGDEKLLNVGRNARRSNLGLERSEESKAKTRAAQSTPERIRANQLLGLANRGRKHSADAMKKMLERCARAIVIEGTEYVSAAEASRVLGFKRQTLEKRLRSDTYPGYFYKDSANSLGSTE